MRSYSVMRSDFFTIIQIRRAYSNLVGGAIEHLTLSQDELYMCVCACLYTRVCVHTLYVCVCIYVFVRVCVCVCVYMYSTMCTVSVQVYVSGCVRVHVVCSLWARVYGVCAYHSLSVSCCWVVGRSGGRGMENTRFRKVSESSWKLGCPVYEGRREKMGLRPTSTGQGGGANETSPGKPVYPVMLFT